MTLLSPSPKQKFFDNNGQPASKYRLFTYAAGTTTKLATYTDSTGGTPNSNPITLDARGECNLWTPPNVGYKYLFTYPGVDDPPGSSIFTVDNILNSQLVTLYGGVDTGVANAYVLNFTANFTAYADGIVIYWIPSHTNTGASTINVNGLGVVNITNQDGTALLPGQLPANQFATIVFKGGAFLLLSQIVQSIYGGVDTGAVNAYVLATQQFAVYRDGLVVYWIPSNTNTGASTININSLGVKNITNQDGSALLAGQLVANQVATMIFKGTAFLLLTSGIAPSILTGSWTPAWSGFATPPTCTASYIKIGSLVTIQFSINSTGTSNANSMQITNIPSAIQTVTGGGSRSPIFVVDNGAEALGSFNFSNVSHAVMTFAVGNPPSQTGFNAGAVNKGLPVFSSLSYMS